VCLLYDLFGSFFLLEIETQQVWQGRVSWVEGKGSVIAGQPAARPGGKKGSGQGSLLHGSRVKAVSPFPPPAADVPGWRIISEVDM